MDAGRWQRIEELFHGARGIPAARRGEFLDVSCGDDDELRVEVERLLRCDEESGAFIETPALQGAAEMIAYERVDAMVGREVGHYRVESLLGVGGMGEVYLARDTRLNRPLAVKVLPARFTGDEARVRRFLQEAQTTSALNHPNIVTVYGVEQLDGLQLMATEFVEGETLRRRLSEGRMGVAEAVAVAAQIASALVAAHAAGVVHRDIKPENVMVRPDRLVKVLDFGIAKLAERSVPVRADVSAAGGVLTTEQGALVGTARYVSPEQARGLAVDERTDTWSLGVVLYEMLAGRVPFDGETRADCIAAVLERAPAPLEEVAPETPAALCELLAKSLRKNADQRFQTAREMSRALEELKRDVEMKESRDAASATDDAARVGGRERGRTRRAAHNGAGVGGRFMRKHTASLFVVLALAAAAAIATFELLPRGSKAINSVAVLPFVNATGDPQAEYLADGITESIINSLSQAPNLKVIARSSVFRYKARDPQSPAPDPRDVARALGVQAVLTGRVVQLGDELLVSAELVNADDDSHLWGEQYSRKVSDVFTVQGEIARAISRQLRLKLAGGAVGELERRSTTNLKAFELYTRGRAYVHRRTREDLEAAARLYEQAIAEDPNYALAYAGLAEAYGNLGVRSYIPPREGRRKLEEAARKAVALDDGLAEAHVAVGYSLMGYAPYDFAGGDRELRRAIELSPSLALAHFYLALSLLRQSRLDEGLEEMLKARELDPLSAIIARQTGLHYLLKRDHARALQILRQANELGPAFTTTNEVEIYIEDGKYEEALEGLEQEKRERKGDPILIFSTGLVYGAQGRRREALDVVRELERLTPDDSSEAEWIAKIYSTLGERDLAFAWLKRGLDSGAVGSFYKDEPVWDSLRGDPRFDDALRRMGMPQ